MSDFCTLDELRQFIAQTGQIPIAGIDDVYLSLCKASATTAIQTGCNRTFETTLTTAVQRTFTYRRPSTSQRTDYYGSIDWSVVYPTLYSGIEAPTLEVDDFYLDAQTITQITVADYTSGTAYTPTRAWPYNAASKGDPFTRLEFANNVALPAGAGQLLVTAKWGWTALPSTVHYACLLQASRYYARRGSPLGVAGFGDQGSALRVRAELDPDVDQMLNDFTRYWAAA